MFLVVWFCVVLIVSCSVFVFVVFCFVCGSCCCVVFVVCVLCVVVSVLLFVFVVFSFGVGVVVVHDTTKRNTIDQHTTTINKQTLTKRTTHQ